MQLIDNPQLIFEQVLALYEAVGWTNYTQHPKMLERALQHSFWTIGAFIDGRLIGLVRVVGDGSSVIFVQDLLVLPEFQRNDVGSRLMQQMLHVFHDVYQIHLVTECGEQTKSFYESLGFQNLSVQNCCAYTYVRQ